MAGLLFIHSSVDEAGLDTSAFRVLCHLARRADGDTGLAFAGLRSMARICRLNKDTTARALRELEACGWIARVKRPGLPSGFRISNAAPIRNQGISALEGHPKPGDIPPDPVNPSETKGREPSPPFGHKVIGNPKKGESRARQRATPSNPPLELTDEELTAIAREFGTDVTLAAAALRIFNENKAAWNESRSAEAFNGWLRTTKAGQAAIRKHTAPGDGKHGSSALNPHKEPDFDWRKLMPEVFPDQEIDAGVLQATEWSAINLATRRDLLSFHARQQHAA